jgi:hypothetical protein
MYAGTESEDDSTKEFYPAALSEFSPAGILQLRSRNDKFPGRDSNPNRRMLIPASSKFIILNDVCRSVIDNCLSKRVVKNSV